MLARHLQGATLKATQTARLVTAANNTNATLGRAGPVCLRQFTGYNAAATVRYIKFYNKVSAPTVGTDTPVLTYAAAPTAAFNVQLPEEGLYFNLGLGFGIVTGSGDSDTTAPSANDVVGLNIIYN
jgi:hypothetical protein